MKTISKNFIAKKLSKIVGADNVLTDEASIYSYSLDSTIKFENQNLFDVVVIPENVNQISEILAWANENKIAIYPKGAGTNVVGGCTTLKGGICLHLSRFNKISDLNQENLSIKAQSGVIVADLANIALKNGLFFPPDPSNLAVSTIGGGISMSSGGARGFKYGTFKDYVLALEVVLADGSIISTGNECNKNVTGYNLTQLFVGSEGTLGIITQATLKLIPKPESSNLVIVYFNSLKMAAKAVNEIILNGITPSLIDLLDKNTLSTIENYLPSGLKTEFKCALFIEIDGFKNVLSSTAKKISDLCSKNNAKFIQIAKSKREIAKMIRARRSALASCAKLAPNVTTEDVVVPRNKIVELIIGIEKFAKEYKIKTCIMGHIGDGNIHPNFAVDLNDKNELKRLNKLKEKILFLALSLGGTLSGEHGIGREKLPFLEIALHKKIFKYNKKIKQLFDPNNILNPKN